MMIEAWLAVLPVQSTDDSDLVLALEAMTVIDLASSMKITRQSPIRSRHPSAPLSRLTSPEPLVA